MAWMYEADMRRAALGAGEVKRHPNCRQVILIDGAAWHWDGGVSCWRDGFGAFDGMTMIGDWVSARTRAERLAAIQ